AVGAADVLGHEVRIFVPSTTDKVIPAVKRRFEERFEVVLYRTPDEIVCDALYVIKRGRPGRITTGIPELNHAFIDASEPHGHRFAAVSEWVARTATRTLRLPRGRTIRVPRLKKPAVVPHIVKLPDVAEDLRDELGIPQDAVVFGRHGGIGTFSVDFVRDAVRSVVDERKDAWFVLINVEQFYEHPRIVDLPMTTDREAIRRFVNTCDYMLHAYHLGETFGLAVAEFALVGAPVITYVDAPRKAHLDLLPDGLRLGYSTYDDLLGHLRTLERRVAPIPSDIAESYSVERVMKRFDEVFLS
ncbi:MAG: hypothetical protein WAQ33_02145, partial [Gaiellaceae bacterium]